MCQLTICRVLQLMGASDIQKKICNLVTTALFWVWERVKEIERSDCERGHELWSLLIMTRPRGRSVLGKRLRGCWGSESDSLETLYACAPFFCRFGPNPVYCCFLLQTHETISLRNRSNPLKTSALGYLTRFSLTLSTRGLLYWPPSWEWFILLVAIGMENTVRL